MGAIADTQPPFWIDVRLDRTVLAFVTAITVAAALVSSVVPGLRVARADANAVLKDDTRGATSLRMGRFGRWLVVVEVAVSCILLVVSGLMIRSIVTTSRLDYPFATRDVFFAQTTFDDRHAPGVMPAVAPRRRATGGRARAPAGVRRRVARDGRAGGGFAPPVSLEGKTYATGRRPRAAQIAATPGYFDVLGVPVRQAAVCSRAGDTARRRAGRGRRRGVCDATSRRRPDARPADPFGDEKAAVAHDRRRVIRRASCRRSSRSRSSSRCICRSRKSRSAASRILARTGGDPIRADRRRCGRRSPRVNGETPLANANSLAGEFWRRGWAFRLFGGLFLTFGAAALVLAAAGLYGVMAFTVRRRTQEIGVRMALGASQRGVLRMVLWQGLWRVALGIALGLWPGWFLGSRWGG